MKKAGLFITLILLLLRAAADADYSAPFDSRDAVLLNCGSTGLAGDPDGRQWSGDVGSRYSPALTSAGPTAAVQDPSVPQTPYLTARIFRSPFTYSFPLGPGRKFLRLHFYPSDYPGAAASDAVFSVTAGAVTLLRNFRAYQTARALNFAYLIREYSVNVSAPALSLTFTPSKAHPNAYAFVNGVEVLSTPDLFGTSMRTPTYVNGGATQPVEIPPAWAMQTVYRLNVGGGAISPPEDSGLFRSWAEDSPYIFGAAFGVSYPADPNVSVDYTANLPAYVAPKDVYASARSMGPTVAVNRNFNLTWILSVDSGFYYLVRLHFCEIQYPITMENMRVFDIFINNQTAQEGADVIAWSGGIGRPVFMDYVVAMAGTGMMDMWIDLHPNEKTRPVYVDAILNGLEVFKLETAGNLAGPNPEFLP